MLIPVHYAQLWLLGLSPVQILARFDDQSISPRMIEWRGLMEIAQGHHPGNQAQAQADADAMLRESLVSLAAAAEILHEQEPVGYPPMIVRLATGLLHGGAVAAVGLLGYPGLFAQSADFVAQLAA
jgi:hypothetical protein